MPKVKKGYSLVQIYKYFIEKKQEKVISERVFKDIVFLFNKKMSQAILEGAVINLPFGLAELRIRKRMFDNVAPSFDYGTYNKTGKKLFHLNEHSDGFRARWFWNKSDAGMKGKSWIKGNVYFRFIPSWTNKRALAQVMKTDGGHKRFME